MKTFRSTQLERNEADEWYKQYIRFIAAVKNRTTRWKEREKFRPSIPASIIGKLKETRKVRNKYYHMRRKGLECEETRVLLRVLTRESKTVIGKCKAARWNEFLTNIQASHVDTEKAFWSHLYRIYKSRSLPFYKLAVGKKYCHRSRRSQKN